FRSNFYQDFGVSVGAPFLGVRIPFNASSISFADLERVEELELTGFIFSLSAAAEASCTSFFWCTFFASVPNAFKLPKIFLVLLIAIISSGGVLITSILTRKY